MNGTHRDADCHSWYGIKFPDLDCFGWLPYMEAADIGMAPERKITIPPAAMVTALCGLVGDHGTTVLLSSAQAR